MVLVPHLSNMCVTKIKGPLYPRSPVIAAPNYPNSWSTCTHLHSLFLITPELFKIALSCFYFLMYILEPFSYYLSPISSDHKLFKDKAEVCHI